MEPGADGPHPQEQGAWAGCGESALTGQSTAWLAAALLGFTAVFGVFTRITFPAFLLAPGCRLVPRFVQR